VFTVLIAASGVSGEVQTALNMRLKAKLSDKPISSLMRPRREPLVAALGFMLVVWLTASAGLPASRTVRRQDPLGGF
jgi:hypothetical protein